MHPTLRLALSIISGLLLALSWNTSYGIIVLFIAFVPLLLIEEFYLLQKKYVFGVFNYSYLTFFIWNLFTTYWIYKATPMGVVLVILTNSAFMAFVFWLYHLSRRVTSQKVGRYALIIWWLAFEHIYFHTEISWPWLTLGNAFADNVSLIQWYEYTGPLGGSLWVLIINILTASLISEIAIKSSSPNKKALTNGILIVLIIAIPFIVSKVIYEQYEEHGIETEVVVLQPNIDPYHEKFESMGMIEQLTKLIQLADQHVTNNTKFIVGPETAITETIWEQHVNNYASIHMIKEFLKENKHMAFVLGASTKKEFSATDKIPPTARKFKNVDIWYDRYNTAIQITPVDISFYHKSKLVLGVEKMPYYRYFKFIDNWAVNLGGTHGSIGFQKESSNFTFQGTTIAPIICYESVYSEYVSSYVQKGAQLLFIVTNDGWWGNTPGYKQHMRYARLRAIENRRSIARSANTGISVFINQRGDIIKETQWWRPTAIKAKLKANDVKTYFTINGDFIGRVATFSTVLILLLMLVSWVLNKKKTI